MNLEDRKKKLESYINSLDNAIHYYDPQTASLKALIQDVRNNDKDGKLDEIRKELELMGAHTSEGDSEQVLLTLESMLFYSSIILPLSGIFNVFESKGKWSFSNRYNIQFNFDENAYSARDIYHLISQLPEDTVLNKLKDVSIKSNTDLIIDAYKRKDENAFVQAFELVQDKQAIKDFFVYVAQIFDSANAFDDYIPELDKLDKDSINDFKILMQLRDELIQKANDSTTVEATNRTSLLVQDFLNPFELNQTIRLYLLLLIGYLETAPKLDSITKEYVNKVIQNPDYIDITNELLAEAERMIKEHNAKNAVSASKHQVENESFPLPFPEHLGIPYEEKQSEFIEALYKELTRRKYVSKKTRIDVFKYLLGDKKPEDYNGEKIEWLKSVTELHCFYVCYYGNTAGKEHGWKVLNKMFFKNGKHNLENNPNDITKKSSESHLETFQSMIERAKGGGLS